MAVLIRPALRSMLGRIAGAACDAAAQPHVAQFSLRNALRMTKAEVLRGSSVAANVVLDAYRRELCGDASRLSELAASGSLQPLLHDQLVRSADAQSSDLSYALIMEEMLDRQQRHLQRAIPKLQAVRLVVGARRSTFDESSPSMYNGFSTHQKWTLGRNFIVVSGQPALRLWEADTQLQLLQEEGCTVQCVVGFESAQRGPGAPQQYVLEAEVPGEAFQSGAEAGSLRQLDADLHFSVVDVNGMVRGNEFWERAEEVSILHWAATAYVH